MFIRTHLSRRFPAHAVVRGVQVAVAIGGDRKAAILCMIAANSCRGIAPFPSLIHCSAVPRLLQKLTTFFDE